MPDRPRWSGNRQEPEPKPFDKVKIIRGKSLRKVTGHDKFANEYTGRMACTLKALTPLHVGSGIYDLEGPTIARGQIKVEGKAIVPGTSLKGAVRAIAEAISDSCVRVTRREIVHHLAVPEVRPCENVRSGSTKPLCVCCSIFGALGYQGRISFTDARLLRGGTSVYTIQSPYPPRESARGYKNAYQQFNGRKFYHHGEPVTSEAGEPYQIIRRDSEMEFAMQFESLTAEELCLLLVAMGVVDDMVIKIGGGKQAMLGSVEVYLKRLELQQTAQSFADIAAGDVVIEGDGVDEFIGTIGQSSQLINESALDELIGIYEYPTSRKAPTGMY